MAEIVEKQESVGRKRKIGQKKGSKGKKKMRVFQGNDKKVKKMDAKTKRLFRKRVRDYNSDNSDDDNDVEQEENNNNNNNNNKKKPVSANRVKFEKKKEVLVENKEDDDANDGEEEVGDDVEEAVVAPRVKFEKKKKKRVENEENDDDEDEDDDDEIGDDFGDDDEEGVVVEHGFMKFSEGSASFKKAFKKIVKRSGTEDEVLGPVLSAHKNFVVKKLAEEAAEKKVKGDAKKEKILLGEKGHVKPDAFSVSYEKTLIGVATKGVVKLFNAVNMAQASQKGLNPLRAKDAKVIQKRKKEAFFSELGKRSSESDSKAGTSGSTGDGEGPSWAPLRDNYMLTTPNLKDWNKAADASEAVDDFGRQEDSSSDDEED
uniref:RRP15-like protein n=1 Tax=Erigeron canadensis TaxID=72917 RepID=UPI001CB8AEA7|nr:RRP15-like protein [Erigeron canadensis]